MPEAGLSSGGRGLGLACFVLALAIAGLLGESLLGGKVLSQSDALGQFAPWSDELGPEAGPSNPVLLDQSIVMQPWQHFAAQRLGRGVLPLWNPNNYAGQPMVGTYQTAYFWPLNWVYYAWPSWSFLAWSAAVRLFLAGLFTYLFLRRLALGSAAALTGAVSFCLSGFMIAWLGHLHTHVALFLPALFWQIERLAQRPSRRNVGIFALLVAGALVAGHLQTAVHVAMAAGAYLLFRMGFGVGTGNPRIGRGVMARVVGAGLLGGLIAMPQLLPFLDYLGASSGATVLEEINTVAAVSPLDVAVLSVDPGHFGSPAAAQGYGPYSGPTGSNLNYNELIGAYVGRLALLLSLIGVVAFFRRKRANAAPFFIGLSLVALLVAWQVWPVYDALLEVPKLRSTKLMRFSLLAAFGLSGLAAFGVQALTRRLGRWSPCLAVLVAMELVLFGRGYNPAIEASAIAPPTAVTDFLRSQLPASGAPATWRALGLDNTTLMPSANLYYDIPMVSGYDSMELRTTTELVALMSSGPDGDFFIKQIGHFDRGFGVAHLLGVRFIMSAGELPAPFALRLDGPTKVYENPAAMPRAFAARELRVIEEPVERLEFLGAPGFDPYMAVLEVPHGARPLLSGEVAIDEYDDLEVRLHGTFAADPGGLADEGLIVLADAWDADWICEVDGEPVTVERVDHGLRGVFVGPGRHELVFRYEPAALQRGLILGLFGLLAVLVLLAWPQRKRIDCVDGAPANPPDRLSSCP